MLAPVLEETVFRGFLLTSLTKFMPTPAAVALSSVAFGLVHLTPRDFPQARARARDAWGGGGARQTRRQAPAQQQGWQRCVPPLTPAPAHPSPRARLASLPQLTALGFLLGFTYVRSRNLLTPILIHGAWNGSVLTVLYLLAESGADIQKVIHGT